MILFQIFKLNFSGNMFKMQYFRNKFSKIAKCWGSYPSYDVIVIRHQIKVTRFFNFGPLLIKISGYANGVYNQRELTKPKSTQ